MTTTTFARCAVAFVLVFVSAAARAQSLAPGTERVFDTGGGQRIRVVGIAGGLGHPWSLAFADARTILVTERPGRLRVIRDGALLPQPAWQAPPPPGNDADGLHFIALHPNFAQNKWVYLSHPKYGEKGNTLAISRGRIRRHHAVQRARDLRGRCMGDQRQPGRTHLLCARRHAVRDGGRPRSLVLHRQG